MKAENENFGFGGMKHFILSMPLLPVLRLLSTTTKANSLSAVGRFPCSERF